MAGGTAMMLQIGHRYSVDFDLFSERSLSDKLPLNIVKIFGKSIITEYNSGDIYSIVTPSEVTVTFVYYPYPLLKKPLITHSLPLFHLDDLAANKAYTIGRRGKWRDYVDLFFLLKEKYYSLTEIINFSGKKFLGEFNDKLFLEQLTYFNDLKIVPIDFIKKKYEPDEIKSFFENQTRHYLQKIL